MGHGHSTLGVLLLDIGVSTVAEAFSGIFISATGSHDSG